ncbi:hypothetical protein HK100_011666 [Physocladia obscura]|uniref:Thioredoxin domain-containing protein n=1 Tax=Physocladia obscura TaxID=109957 RepID=A0AAD5TB36_9FUNG|nr:hypothetical protein HK100_011666 [Physocladia obscura]
MLNRLSTFIRPAVSIGQRPVSQIPRFFSASTVAAHYYARVQLPAPSFSASAVVDGAFKTVSLEDYKDKWLVLFFYPLDFTFVCPTEIISYSEAAEEFKKLNCAVVGCSVVSDITKQISSDYGVLIDQGDDIGLSLRGTFIIDPKQVIRHITINDLGVGRSIEETLRLVEAFQFNDKHGEVCPAGWKKGAKSMIPDPKKSKEYFKAVN